MILDTTWWGLNLIEKKPKIEEIRNKMFSFLFWFLATQFQKLWVLWLPLILMKTRRARRSYPTAIQVKLQPNPQHQCQILQNQMVSNLIKSAKTNDFYRFSSIYSDFILTLNKINILELYSHNNARVYFHLLQLLLAPFRSLEGA